MIDAFYDVAIAFERHGFRKPPNLEVELQAFLLACKESRKHEPEEKFQGRAIRMALRAQIGKWGVGGVLHAMTSRAEEVWVTEDMARDGVRFAAPQGWMTIRAFPEEREKLLAQIEKFGMVI